MRANLIAMAATLLAAAEASAAPLAASALPARVAGAEFRGYFQNGAFFENQIWRLAPDGTVRATYHRVRGSSQQNNYSEAGQDAGRWTIEGDRLCVQFTALFAGQKRCYIVDARQGIHVRLTGPESIEGTLSH